MIASGAGVRVYLACEFTDMRKGIAGLAGLAQDVLRKKPTCGVAFVFRGRRGDRIKLLYWDGQCFFWYHKVLERGRFRWPSAGDGAARLATAQLAMLWGESNGAGRNGARRQPVSVNIIVLNFLLLWHFVARHARRGCAASTLGPRAVAFGLNR